MPSPGTFTWVLDRRTGWRELAADDVASGRALELAATPGGPLDLLSRDGSLGGLVLPQGMALDAECTLHLLLAGERIARFDAAARAFQPLPATGGRGRGARQLRRPLGLAIAGDRIYVADTGNRRIQVFDLPTLALLHVWGTADVRSAWVPWDVAAGGDTAYILDRAGGRVLAHRRGDDLPHVAIDGGPPGAWTRLAVDTGGVVHTLDRGGRCLEAHDGSVPRRCTADPAALRDRFAPTALRVDGHGRLFLPDALMRPCARTRPAAPTPLGHPPSASGAFFDRWTGRPVDPPSGEEALAERSAAYRTSGSWTSEPLDSAEHAFRWHRVELEVRSLPPGTTVIAYTATSDRGPGDRPTWREELRATGRLRPPAEAAAPAPATHEALVSSPPGRRLRVRLVLTGEGDATPVVTAVRIHGPRRTYLENLPAVYSRDEESRSFLERFLSVVQTEWDALDDRIEATTGLFDTESVPAGAALKFIAGWIGAPVEEGWSAGPQRRLLTAVSEHLGRRGTPRALRAYLRAYLAALSGQHPDDVARTPFPCLAEGFRERREVLLRGSTAALGHGGPVWSPAVVSRLQLGTYSQEGRARLVSVGDPQLDVFNHYAHRFQVVVPASWVRTAGAAATLRRAIEAEKPAHANYDLCLVDCRLRVGVQATVGVDAIVGTYPLARLASADGGAVDRAAPPDGRLGMDTVLAGAHPGRLPRTEVVLA